MKHSADFISRQAPSVIHAQIHLLRLQAERGAPPSAESLRRLEELAASLERASLECLERLAQFILFLDGLAKDRQLQLEILPLNDYDKNFLRLAGIRI
jgi:hypothetical protein